MLYKIVKKTFPKGFNVDKDHWLVWKLNSWVKAHSKKDPKSVISIRVIIKKKKFDYKGYITRDDTYDRRTNKPSTRIRIFYDSDVGTHMLLGKSLKVDFDSVKKIFLFYIDDSPEEASKYKGHLPWSENKIKRFLLKIADRTNDVTCIPSISSIKKHGHEIEPLFDYKSFYKSVQKLYPNEKGDRLWSNVGKRFGFQTIIILYMKQNMRMNIGDFMDNV